MKDIKKEKNRYRKFSTKFILFLIIAAIVPLMALGSASYIRIRGLVLDEAKENYNVILEQTTRTIEAELNTISQSLININSSMYISAVVDYDKKELIKSNDYQQPVVKVEELVDETIIKTMLDGFNNLIKNEEEVINVFLATENGNFYTLPEVELENFDPRERPWYIEAVNLKENFWTEPYVDTQSKKIITSYIIPIVDNGGNIEAVLGVDISLEDISKNISSTKIGRSGRVSIISNNGIVLANENEEVIGSELYTDEEWKNFLSSEGQYTDYYDENYGKNLTALSRTSDKLGWKVVFTIETLELKEELVSTGLTILIITLIGIIFAILVGKFMGNSIKSQLISSIRGLEALEKGELKEIENKATTKEFRDLIDTINRTYNSAFSLE